jgi:hypothetical protein
MPMRVASSTVRPSLAKPTATFNDDPPGHSCDPSVVSTMSTSDSPITRTDAFM